MELRYKLIILLFLFFASTEGHFKKLQMWSRLSALSSGQQAPFYAEGRRAADQTGSSDRCGCRRGERSHCGFPGERTRTGLQGAVVFVPAGFALETFCYMNT